ncbi:hypothetical protein TNCV_4937691 [Trichonephila clavipes]|nr:hypothetical protein TNCV_4937691 [Trichonephila clavipes]
MTASICQLLNSLIANVKILIQRIPSLEIVCRSEVVDGLTREGSHTDSTHGGGLNFSKITYWGQARYQFLLKPVIVHGWNEGNRPGALSLGTSNRQAETLPARLLSGQSRAQRHVAGHKVYPPCRNSNMALSASWLLWVAIRLTWVPWVDHHTLKKLEVDRTIRNLPQKYGDSCPLDEDDLAKLIEVNDNKEVNSDKTQSV